MILLLAILVLLGDVLLGAILVALLDIKRSDSDMVDEVRSLRLVSRARMKRAAVRSGVAEPEVELRRLGRVAQPRRVVFGGDGDSELNKVLGKVQTGEGDEGE
jgi:hypothetical protein